ncbi:hypothetical protein EI94DRAFT_1706452 [Lactarius quietus]|nr:hypothetical protein EI94DRAFT_1706452 [Lactarius quietus]
MAAKEQRKQSPKPTLDSHFPGEWPKASSDDSKFLSDSEPDYSGSFWMREKLFQAMKKLLLREHEDEEWEEHEAKEQKAGKAHAAKTDAANDEELVLSDNAANDEEDSDSLAGGERQQISLTDEPVSVLQTRVVKFRAADTETWPTIIKDAVGQLERNWSRDIDFNKQLVETVPRNGQRISLLLGSSNGCLRNMARVHFETSLSACITNLESGWYFLKQWSKFWSNDPLVRDFSDWTNESFGVQPSNDGQENGNRKDKPIEIKLPMDGQGYPVVTFDIVRTNLVVLITHSRSSEYLLIGYDYDSSAFSSNATPVLLSWEAINHEGLSYKKLLISKFMGEMYRIVEGSGKGRIPWARLKDAQGDFIHPKYLPSGITLTQYHHIHCEDVDALLQHWLWRQGAGEITLQFKNIGKADRCEKQVSAADDTSTPMGPAGQLERDACKNQEQENMEKTRGMAKIRVVRELMCRVMETLQGTQEMQCHLPPATKGVDNFPRHLKSCQEREMREMMPPLTLHAHAHTHTHAHTILGENPIVGQAAGSSTNHVPHPPNSPSGSPTQEHAHNKETTAKEGQKSPHKCKKNGTAGNTHPHKQQTVQPEPRCSERAPWPAGWLKEVW